MLEVSGDIINKIIDIVKSGGGEVYEQNGYINFFGVRDNKTDNTFNDTLYIYWKDVVSGDFKCVRTSGFTTKPGKRVILNEDGKQNLNGAAIVKEGWYKDVWHHGKHKGEYEALRQTSPITNPITITRDKTQYGLKSNTYELRVLSDTAESGYFGINFHKSGDPNGKYVNNWSAGCQVFQYKNEFDEAMQMSKSASKMGQKTFSYFLTNKNVFDIDGVIDDSINNNDTSIPYDFSQSQFANDVVVSEDNGSLYSNNNVSGLGDSGSYDNSTIEYGGRYKSTSFGTDVIFGEVFPDDDNNRYIDMSADDISVIQYTEPTLKVDDLNLFEKNYNTIGIYPEKISFYTPVVCINDFIIPQTCITNFCLDYSSFAPQVMVEFVDIRNDMLSTNIPKQGSYIKVFIGGQGDEKYYKPIRQDFIITNIDKTNKTGGTYQNYRNPIKYRINGILNVPLGFRKMPWSSSKINARQAVFNISNTIGLGFATNFNINSDVDVMRWINTQNKSFYDFIKDITRHSCYSPYTFFTSFIDQYYVLNYVECRRLLSHGGKKTDTPQMIYNCILPEMERNKTDNTDENLNSGEQKVSYYFLTNDEKFNGWTNYIEEYFELNDGYSIMTDGYRKTLTYSDKCGFQNLPSKNYKFLVTPIDNIKRDDNKNIMSLPDEVDKDTYIPLNLRQTTNSEYVYNQKFYDNPTAAESTIDVGEVDTSNTFPLYFYASVQNDFQMKNLKKCGLSVRLQNYNPSITRYSRIWVDIYDMNYNSSEQIRKDDTVDEIEDSAIKEFLKKRNDNIIVFEEDKEGDNKLQTYNRSLSGWYVVTDMKISYNTVKDFKGNTYKKLQTQLILNRIDYRPSFKSEYELAKISIDKYKRDNIPENIMCGDDIIQ